MTDVVLRAPERETRTTTTGKQRGLEALLFGRSALHCEECGREVKPLDAYWQSASVVYCSPEHAYLDRG